MCSDHTHIRRLAQVNSYTLIVFIAHNRLCDYEMLLHLNVRQHAVFPIAHVPLIIPLLATVGTGGCEPWFRPMQKSHQTFVVNLNRSMENRLLCYQKC